MLVKLQSIDRVSVLLQGDKTVQGRPEAVAVQRQDDAGDLIIFLDQVDRGVTGPAPDPGDVFIRGDPFTHGRVFGRLPLIIA